MIQLRIDYDCWSIEIWKIAEDRHKKRDLIRVLFLVYFQIGDRIIEVDGVDLRHSTHERAVEVIQAAGNPVCLLVQSLVHLVRPRHDQEYRCTPFPFHPHLLRIFSHYIPIIVDYLTIWFSYRIVDDLGLYNWQFELFNLIF